VFSRHGEPRGVQYSKLNALPQLQLKLTHARKVEKKKERAFKEP